MASRIVRSRFREALIREGQPSVTLHSGWTPTDPDEIGFIRYLQAKYRTPPVHRRIPQRRQPSSTVREHLGRRLRPGLHRGNWRGVSGFHGVNSGTDVGPRRSDVTFAAVGHSLLVLVGSGFQSKPGGVEFACPVRRGDTGISVRGFRDAAASCDIGSLAKGDAVRDRYGWHRVVTVNKVSVSVETGYDWTDLIRFDRIIETRKQPTG